MEDGIIYLKHKQNKMEDLLCFGMKLLGKNVQIILNSMNFSIV